MIIIFASSSVSSSPVTHSTLPAGYFTILPFSNVSSEIVPLLKARRQGREGREAFFVSRENSNTQARFRDLVYVGAITTLATWKTRVDARARCSFPPPFPMAPFKSQLP